MLIYAKANAKRAGVPFDLTLEDMVIPERCPILGIPLDREGPRKSDNSPTVDRIVPELGYVKGNFAVISWRANRLKNNATPKELQAISTWVSTKVAKPVDKTNPKDLLGIKKVSVSKLPFAGILHGAMAMQYGASKYGPFNWRGNSVVASIYIDATLRHLAAWFDSKERCAPDSGVHHLGHVLANMAILLDAEATGNLIDDRPEGGKSTEVLETLNAKIKAESSK